MLRLQHRGAHVRGGGGQVGAAGSLAALVDENTRAHLLGHETGADRRQWSDANHEDSRRKQQYRHNDDENAPPPTHCTEGRALVTSARTASTADHVVVCISPSRTRTRSCVGTITIS